MLKKSDLSFKVIWDKWNQVLNIAFESGFVENIREVNGVKYFDLRQTPFAVHSLKVMLNKDDYLPAVIEEGAPVKLYGRLTQDSECNYPSIVLKLLYCERAGLYEIPSEDNFIAKANGSQYKIVNPYVSLVQSSGTKRKHDANLKKFQNNVELAGFLRTKKKVSDDCIYFDLWNQEKLVLPSRVYGKECIRSSDELKLLRPVRVRGRLESREHIVDSVPQKQIYIKVENIGAPLIIDPDMPSAKSKKVSIYKSEIPSIAPNWYVKACEELKRSGAVQAVDQNINTEEVINYKELDSAKHRVNPNDIFRIDDGIVFDD